MLVFSCFSLVSCMSLGYFWIKLQRHWDAEYCKILKLALLTAVENPVFDTRVSLKNTWRELGILKLELQSLYALLLKNRMLFLVCGIWLPSENPVNKHYQISTCLKQCFYGGAYLNLRFMVLKNPPKEDTRTYSRGFILFEITGEKMGHQ